MEHIPPNQYESLAPELDNRSELIEGRHIAAERAARSAVEKSLIQIDRATISRSPIAEVSTKTANLDIGELYLSDLVAFDAIGISPERLLSSPALEEVDEGQEYLTITHENENLHIKKYREGVSLQIEIDNPDHKPGMAYHSVIMKQMVQERFADSPPYKQIAELRALVEDGSHVGTYTTEPFSAVEDPLATLSFLEDVGLCRVEGDAAKRIKEGEEPEVLVYEYLSKITSPQVRRENDETGITYTWGDEVIGSLHMKEDSKELVYSVTPNPEAFHEERANQRKEARSVPFLDTECAAELCSWLDRNGLMFSPRLQLEMMHVGEARRFGSIYTLMSREIAKWVDRSHEGRVVNLFIPYDTEFSPSKLARNPDLISNYTHAEYVDPDEEHAKELRVIEALKTADTDGMGEAASVLLNMAQQAVSRSSYKSDLPVTKQTIDISDGACFDVALYYINAADVTSRGLNRSALNTTKVNDSSLLEINHGTHTFISMDPILFNGVELPKGSLFSRAPDGGYLFQRITPFAFDRKEDQLATGSELAKAYHDEAKAIAQIGGVSLRHLIDSTG